MQVFNTSKNPRPHEVAESTLGAELASNGAHNVSAFRGRTKSVINQKDAEALKTLMSSQVVEQIALMNVQAKELQRRQCSFIATAQSANMLAGQKSSSRATAVANVGVSPLAQSGATPLPRRLEQEMQK